jgi:ectoine hydroxylase-related dioxygenase (phytanoyl-CoA dioxygenase family)
MKQLDECGFAVVRRLLDEAAVSSLIDALGAVQRDGAGARRRGDVYAMRNLATRVPAVGRLASLVAVREVIEPILGPDAFVTRALLFDKTAGANWKVPWHQDLTIAVARRCDVGGFGPWSCKEGVPHVQPPVEILARMLTLRLHLDECDSDNGPLKVAPGSHKAGRLDAAAISGLRARRQPVAITVERGDALLMRPLLLHASAAAKNPRHRRVIHLEWAAEELPGGLQWAMG